MNLSKEYLMEDATTNYIEKSGCYEFEIKKAEHFNSPSSKAQALKLFLENDLGSAVLSLYFKTKEGSDNQFNLRNISHLAFLTRVPMENVEATYSTEDKSKLLYKCFHEKRIGVILECREGEKGSTEYILKSFYDPKSKRTSKEIKSGEEAETYKKFNLKYNGAGEQPVKQKTLDDEIRETFYND